MPEQIAEQGVVDSAAAPVVQEASAPVVLEHGEDTLLGSAGAEKVAAEKVVAKEPTPEEKAAADAKAVKDAEVSAENKKLLESDDKTLTPEQLTKKQELQKQVEAEKGNVVPEKYEFKMPDGVKVNQELVDGLSPVLKDMKITQAQAQKLVDAYTPIILKQAQAMAKTQADESIKVFNQIKTDWKEQTNKMLGTNKDAELGHAARFINQYGTKELRQALNDTGLGNHPELVRIFIAAGKKLAPDSMPGGKTIKPGGEGGLDPAKFYNHPTSPK